MHFKFLHNLSIFCFHYHEKQGERGINVCTIYACTCIHVLFSSTNSSILGGKKKTLVLKSYLCSIQLCKFRCIRCWSKWNPQWYQSQCPYYTGIREWSETEQFSQCSALFGRPARCKLCKKNSNDDTPWSSPLFQY